MNFINLAWEIRIYRIAGFYGVLNNWSTVCENVNKCSEKSALKMSL